jgi:hypothetical protein
MALSSGAMSELSCSASLPAVLLFSMSAPSPPPAGEIGLAVGGKPFLGEPPLELVRTTEFAQDQLKLADDQLKKFDLPVEQLKDVRLNGSGRREVHDLRYSVAGTEAGTGCFRSRSKFVNIA